MRATRAFVGAFGAGISMAVASSLVLLVVSSVVAFNGWPDDLKGAEAPKVARLATGTPAASSAPAATRPIALELPAAVAAGERGTGRATERVATRTTGETAVVGTTETTVTETATPPEESGGPSPEATPRVPSTKPVTDVVRETTKVVGETVAPVTPVVGGALESVGAAGADTVDTVSETVDGAVQQLLP